jgi:hypothetical protein
MKLRSFVFFYFSESRVFKALRAIQTRKSRAVSQGLCEWPQAYHRSPLFLADAAPFPSIAGFSDFRKEMPISMAALSRRFVSQWRHAPLAPARRRR